MLGNGNLIKFTFNEPIYTMTVPEEKDLMGEKSFLVFVCVRACV